MTSSPRVCLVADAAAAHALTPLLEVWRSAGGCRVIPWGDANRQAGLAGLPGPAGRAALASLVELVDDSEALLVIGPRNRSPRTVLPGPVIVTRDARTVPAAWLPDTGMEALARFAEAATAVHEREGSRQRHHGMQRPGVVEGSSMGSPTMLVLGERHARFDRLADRVLALAAEAKVNAERCTAYELRRDDLAQRLAGGFGLGVYVGHGRPKGWCGYAGVRAHHLVPGRPLGALVSLTCHTASRRRTGLSFAEAAPLLGVAAASLGAICPTMHTANTRWAVRLTLAVPTAATIGDLVVAVAPHDPGAASYRLMGDPTAPLLDAPAQERPLSRACPLTHPLQEAS